MEWSSVIVLNVVVAIANLLYYIKYSDKGCLFFAIACSLAVVYASFMI